MNGFPDVRSDMSWFLTWRLWDQLLGNKCIHKPTEDAAPWPRWANVSAAETIQRVSLFLPRLAVSAVSAPNRTERTLSHEFTEFICYSGNLHTHTVLRALTITNRCRYALWSFGLKTLHSLNFPSVSQLLLPSSSSPSLLVFFLWLSKVSWWSFCCCSAAGCTLMLVVNTGSFSLHSLKSRLTAAPCH